MVPTCLKKRNKPDMPEAVIQGAIRAVHERRLILRVAASRYRMTHTALHYRIKKKISDGDECNWSNVFTSRYTSWQILSKNQELMLVDCVIKCSKLNYGMTYKQIHQLSYDYGRRLECIPSSWLDNKIAGIDWFHSKTQEPYTLQV